jgi:hypothetical protein
VARDVIPEIVKLAYTYVNGITPQRGRDIARIFGSGGGNLVNILKNTSRGKSVRKSSVNTFDALVDLSSSPTGRQLVIDVAAWWLKRAESCVTPEAKASNDAWLVSWIRLVDLLASSDAKQLYHTMNDGYWELSKLIADSDTATATAEVVANIVHALSMENAVYRKVRNTNLSDKDKARLRRRRARRAKMSREGVVAGQDLERAILDAFGGGDVVDNFDDDDYYDDDGDEGLINGNGDDCSNNQDDSHDDESGSETSSVVDSGETPTRAPAAGAAAAAAKQTNAAAQVGDVFTMPTSDLHILNDGDVAPPPPPSSPHPEDIDRPVVDVPPSAKKKKAATASSGTGSTTTAPSSSTSTTTAATTTSAPFDVDTVGYRLNSRKKMLATQAKRFRSKKAAEKKQSPTFLQQLEHKVQSNNNTTHATTGRNFYDLAAAAAGAGNERGQDSAFGHSDVGVEVVGPDTAAVMERYMAYLGLFVILVLGACVVWTLLGCYGLYVAFFGGGGGGGVAASEGVTVIYKFVTESESAMAAAVAAAGRVAGGGEL